MNQTQTQKSVVVDAPVILTTNTRAVAVYGSELVSKRDLEILGHCLNMLDKIGMPNTDHGIRMVAFTVDTPAFILANNSHEAGAIVINLGAHFTKAMEHCENKNDDVATYGIYGIYQRMLLMTYLHEIHHNITLNYIGASAASPLSDEKRQDVEAEAEEFALKGFIQLAKITNIEPSHFSESPFFCEMFHRLDEKMLEEQQTLLENNTFFLYTPPKGEFGQRYAIHSLREIAQIESDDPESDDWKNNVPEQDLMTRIMMLNGDSGNTTAPVETVANANTEFTAEPDFEAEAGLEMEEDNVVPFVPTSPAPQPMPAANAAPAPQSAPAAPPVHSYNMETVAQVVTGVFAKIYNHVFTHCQPALNGTNGFNYPDAVYKTGIEMSDLEKEIITHISCLDLNGQYHAKAATTDTGALYGSVTKKLGLPVYRIFINVGGAEMVRTLLPQNMYKLDVNGQYSKYAKMAQSGQQVMWIKDEGNNKFVKKIINGQLQDA